MMEDYRLPSLCCSFVSVCMKEFEPEVVNCVKAYCPQTHSMEIYSQAATDPQGHGFFNGKNRMCVTSGISLNSSHKQVKSLKYLDCSILKGNTHMYLMFCTINHNYMKTACLMVEIPIFH